MIQNCSSNEATADLIEWPKLHVEVGFPIPHWSKNKSIKPKTQVNISQWMTCTLFEREFGTPLNYWIQQNVILRYNATYKLVTWVDWQLSLGQLIFIIGQSSILLATLFVSWRVLPRAPYPQSLGLHNSHKPQAPSQTTIREWQYTVIHLFG